MRYVREHVCVMLIYLLGLITTCLQARDKAVEKRIKRHNDMQLLLPKNAQQVKKSGVLTKSELPVTLPLFVKVCAHQYHYFTYVNVWCNILYIVQSKLDITRP